MLGATVRTIAMITTEHDDFMIIISVLKTQKNMIYKYCKPQTFLLLCEFPGLVLHLFVHELVNEHEHLAPAGPQGVGGPGDASAVRWGGLYQLVRQVEPPATVFKRRRNGCRPGTDTLVHSRTAREPRVKNAQPAAPCSDHRGPAHGRLSSLVLV